MRLLKTFLLLFVSLSVQGQVLNEEVYSFEYSYAINDSIILYSEFNEDRTLGTYESIYTTLRGTCIMIEHRYIGLADVILTNRLLNQGYLQADSKTFSSPIAFVKLMYDSGITRLLMVSRLWLNEGYK